MNQDGGGLSEHVVSKDSNSNDEEIEEFKDIEQNVNAENLPG